MAGANFTPNLPETVTLNSFQGLFLGTDRSVVRQQGGSVCSLPKATERAARWTLKQVQGDEDCEVVL